MGAIEGYCLKSHTTVVAMLCRGLTGESMMKGRGFASYCLRMWQSGNAPKKIYLRQAKFILATGGDPQRALVLERFYKFSYWSRPPAPPRWNELLSLAT